MRTSRVFALGGVLGGLGSGALWVAVPTVAVGAQSGSVWKAINLPAQTTQHPLFSDAVQAGKTLYLSGRLGMDPDTGEVPAEPQQEARNVLDQIQSVLQEAGMTMDDLVNGQVLCSDVAFYNDFNMVYRTYFTTEDLPARAFLGAGGLLRGARFEVNGIAVKRPS